MWIRYGSPAVASCRRTMPDTNSVRLPMGLPAWSYIVLAVAGSAFVLLCIVELVRIRLHMQSPNELGFAEAKRKDRDELENLPDSELSLEQLERKYGLSEGRFVYCKVQGAKGVLDSRAIGFPYGLCRCHKAVVVDFSKGSAEYACESCRIRATGKWHDSWAAWISVYDDGSKLYTAISTCSGCGTYMARYDHDDCGSCQACNYGWNDRQY